MQKIILLTDSLGPGGAQRQLCGLAVMLNSLSYDVTVVTYFKNDFYKDLLDDNRVRNIVVGEKTSVLQRIECLRQFIKSERPRWVVSYQETPSLIASFIRFTGIKFKLIVSERNTTQQITLKDRTRFYFYRFANVIVPNSYSQEKFLSERYSWMTKRLKTISNFVDLDTFSYCVHSRNCPPLIVVAASIWPPKNTIGLIEALKILSQQNVLFQVKWFGYSAAHDDYFKQALAKVEEYGLSGQVELLPKTQSIHEVYRQCDYLCLPSFYEGVPNVIAEAMSTGRPILCSNVCDNPRYVVDGVNGYLFDPNNPEDIAEKILKGLSISDQEYSQMCQESRKRAEKMLSMDTFINKYIEILKEC